MGDPKNVYIDLGVHGALRLGRSTDMALPALCILAHCGSSVPVDQPGGVVSSSLLVTKGLRGASDEPHKT
jgi:hypothetical protein